MMKHPSVSPLKPCLPAGRGRLNISIKIPPLKACAGLDPVGVRGMLLRNK